MQNTLKIMNINQLCSYSFFVPSYQRGYRWTNLEVEDLLNDINDFEPREIANSDDHTWYCLQPLVVKKREDNDKFELIDGQQRITTIYLILYYLNQDYVEAKRDKLFDLSYETREKSREFLQHPETESDENIDFYYISQAYKVIEKWFLEKSKSGTFDKNHYKSKIQYSAKIIWYETTEEEAIPVFSRLNIGKISLTNSELIKALFLNSSNYGRENADKIRHRQFEIASEWDAIETALQNDKFWYFLSNKEKNDNRIELIFDLIADKDNYKDVYFTFRFFSKAMEAKTLDTINANWKIIKDYFQRFLEWFQKREWYHKIGFIVSEKILDIQSIYKNSITSNKTDFSDFLDKTIRNYYSKASLLDLQYGDAKTKSVLLLYNIATMLNNDKEQSFFPFDIFKQEKWDIEHIASLTDNTAISQIENRKQWIDDVSAYIDNDGDELKKIIGNANIKNDDEFENAFKQINEYFNKELCNKYTNQIDEPNGISNLTLLDSFTNRSYKNSVFPIKRARIIERDKNGKFVPICTKNTFLKYFSEYPPKISLWTSDDRDKYEKDLVSILSKYMKVE